MLKNYEYVRDVLGKGFKTLEEFEYSILCPSDYNENLSEIEDCSNSDCIECRNCWSLTVSESALKRPLKQTKNLNIDTYVIATLTPFLEGVSETLKDVAIDNKLEVLKALGDLNSIFKEHTN